VRLELCYEASGGFGCRFLFAGTATIGLVAGAMLRARDGTPGEAADVPVDGIAAARTAILLGAAGPRRQGRAEP